MKGIKEEGLINGYFNFEDTDYNVKNMGKFFKKYRENIGWTQTKYSEEFRINLILIRRWEYGLNNIPIKDIFRILRLNGLDPYKELNKNFPFLNIGRINFPLKPTKELFEILEWIIPQKSFNHACVIRRESKKLSREKFNKLIDKIENYLNCKIKDNKHNGAFYIYSAHLSSFLDRFFIYEKGWSIMDKLEINTFNTNMKKFLEVNMVYKLPFDRGRQVLIKKEAETDISFGKNPKDRSVEELLDFGIINLNKPAGPT